MCVYVCVRVVCFWLLVSPERCNDPHVVHVRVCARARPWQVSIAVLVCLLLSPSSRTLFYCHYPDALLSRHDSLLKRLYRAPFDWLEELTTGLADEVLVNSYFTAGVFRRTFPRLAECDPEVLYPCVRIGPEPRYARV